MLQLPVAAEHITALIDVNQLDFNKEQKDIIITKNIDRIFQGQIRKFRDSRHVCNILLSNSMQCFSNILCLLLQIQSDLKIRAQDPKTNRLHLVEESRDQVLS